MFVSLSAEVEVMEESKKGREEDEGGIARSEQRLEVEGVSMS